ncbi:UDP-N-acetylglucosamine 2-epimerase (non-hydrolyzing) [bacterium]|nr:UDP-N-acetylglucosamine 2-epimerase (non-hydrolyzing) [bacterium]MDB4754150.1 UDP-N-acetylglucosamine 2-epimerase (non-hydrolyzing) [Akkermansiaceae bacterium]
MSERKKVVVVAGTRPEVIKMSSVYMELRKSESLEPIFLSTGQHREMLAQAFGAFDLTPDDDLELMQPGQDLTGLTARVLQAVGDYLKELQPAAVLVQGDTTSVLASAMAAFYQGIPVGHVEAGLRTHNMLSPWPEEMNRRLVSPLCRWHFLPTEVSKANLLAESIPEKDCHVTGNTVIDSLLWMRSKVNASTNRAEEISERLSIPPEFTASYLEGGKRWILVTGHRRESHGSGFDEICRAIRSLVEDHPDLGILYPVHLNPKVREPVMEALGGNPRIALVDPAGYEDFIWLMDRCYFALSDSGGVQEEAPSLGKPVLVMRESTERPEGVDAGTCRLVGTNFDRIHREATLLLTDDEEYLVRSKIKNPYGDGTAAEKVRLILEEGLL